MDKKGKKAIGLGGGGGGRLFKGRDFLKKFPSKGAIIRGTAIMRGNTVSMIFHLPVYKAPT